MAKGKTKTRQIDDADKRLTNARHRIEAAREHTKGTLTMALAAQDEEELAYLKKAAKGMRGIKNLSFIIDEGRRIG